MAADDAWQVPRVATRSIMPSVPSVTVIGGTALSGGTISAVGFLFSGLLMALIRNGLIMLGVNVYFEATFLGVIILLAVMVEYFRLNVTSRARKL